MTDDESADEEENVVVADEEVKAELEAADPFAGEDSAEADDDWEMLQANEEEFERVLEDPDVPEEFKAGARVCLALARREQPSRADCKRAGIDVPSGDAFGDTWASPTGVTPAMVRPVAERVLTMLDERDEPGTR